MTPPLIDADLDRAPTLRLRVVAALFVAAGLTRFAYFYLDDLTRHVSGTLMQRALEEGTGVLASAALFPIAVFFERRFPLDRGRWRRAWLPHLGGLMAYSFLHTTFMAVSRSLLFPAVAHVAYDYGTLSIRYVMEASQDVVSYAIFVGILTLLRTQQRLRDREVHGAKLERDAVTARLESLRLRLQPHFLFNALNTISSTVYEDPIAADDLIGRLGDLLRQSLESSDRPEIALWEELEVLHAYQAFVEARFGDRTTFAYDIDPSADLLAVPAFLLQPLVENGVHHGLSSEFSHVEIAIAAKVVADGLCIRVENTTPAARDRQPRVGIGLGATGARLRLLYGQDASLQTEDSGDRFVVTIRVPARSASLTTPTHTPSLARADR
ncbi:MAG TPA: histidine kinase [Gemmatimonadaceae bacterium]|jgi:LytS/YehU family sensor histidine kinase